MCAGADHCRLAVAAPANVDLRTEETMFERAIGRIGASISIGLLVLSSSACTSAPGGPGSAIPAAVIQQAALGAVQTLTVAQAPVASALDINPCALLTVDEAAAILGPLSAGPVSEPGPTEQPPECGFISGEGGGLIISVADAATWDVRKSFIRPDDHAVTVPGLGDEAIYASSDQGMDMLVVLAKPYVLELHLNIDAERDQQMAVAAAHKALPRLK